MAVDSLGYPRDAARACPSSSPPRTRPRRGIDAASLPAAERLRQHRRARAWAAPAIVGDVLAVVGTASLPVPVVVLQAVPHAGVRRAPHARLRASRTRATPRRPSRWRAARSTPGARLVMIVTCGGALVALGRRARRAPPSRARRDPDAACRARRDGRAAVRHVLPHGHAARSARDAGQGPGAARRAVATQCTPRGRGATEPGARARPQHRSHDPARLRRRRARRGRGDALEVRRSTRTPRRPRSGTPYPELDHNEICGWGQHGDVTRQVLTLVELRHGCEHAQLDQRSVTTPRDDRGGVRPGARGARPRARGASRSCST